MAKRFQFRLEPVLRQNERLEEERLRDFAVAQASYLEQEEELAALAGEKGSQQDDIVELYRSGAEFASILERHRYINTLNLRAAFGRRELAGRGEKLETEREKLLEARKNRRALEILKERRREEHAKQAAAAEARYLDELAIQRHRAEKD